MNAILLDKILKTAHDFATIAKRVNISSRLRTNHSREGLVCISYLRSIITNLLDDLKYVAEKNITQKESDSEVKTYYEKLKIEIKNFSSELDNASVDKYIDKEVLKKLTEIYDEFKESTAGALEKLEIIISRDDEIIEKDKEIINLKVNQLKLLEKLQNDTQKSCNDALKAVKGSQSNLDRGLKMVSNLEQVELLIENKNINELNNLLKETHKGWVIAEGVHSSSRSQLEFAEKVYENTQELHNESNKIEDLVVDRHKFYAESLHIFAELTEILTSKFKKYSEADAILNALNITETSSKGADKLTTHIKNISEIAHTILKMNNERIHSSHYYADNEASTVDLIKEETEYFNKIIEEIEFMTETTRYPIEGSNNNITNGQILEELLINALKTHDIPIEDIN